MKYIFRLMTVIAIVAVSTAFTSNDKDVKTPTDPEVRYACEVVLEDGTIDDSLNDFIIENLDFVSSMSREQAATYKLSTMKAIFRTWSETRMQEAWRDKLQQDAHHFDGEQKEFILDAYDNKPTQEEMKPLFSFEVAKAVFVNLKTLDEQGYDRSKLLAQAGEEPDGTAGSEQGEHGGWGNGGNPTGDGSVTTEDSGEAGDGGSGAPTGGGCNCAYSDDWCPSSGGNGCSYGCSGASSWGCGLFWSYACNGSCQ